MNVDGKTEWEIVKLFQSLEAQGTGLPTRREKNSGGQNASVVNAEIEKILSSPQALAELWGAYASQQAIAESDDTAPLLARIKLKLASSKFAFSLDNLTAGLSPFAMTPVASVRGGNANLLESCSFSIVRPELPGIVVSMVMQGESDHLQFRFLFQGKNFDLTYVILKDQGDLAEMQSLTGGGCSFYIPTEDTGTYSFSARLTDGREIPLVEIEV